MNKVNGLRSRKTLLCFLFFVFIFFIQTLFQNWNLLIGISRPVWDLEWKKNHVNIYNLIIPNFGFEEDDIEGSCRLHNFTLRGPENAVNRVFLCLPFSIELDLLEIQLNQLHEVVDYFLIAESNTTFRGKDKNMFFLDNKNLFRKFWKKIIHVPVVAPNGSKLSGFEMESTTRATLQRRLHSLVNMEGDKITSVSRNDWIITADVDELVRKSVIQLVRSCETPSKLQLDMGTSSFKYSFEFKIPVVSNNLERQPANIQKWGDGIAISHQTVTDCIFMDAGWHCSWCFNYIEEFIFKMVSYSHSFLDNPNTLQYVDKNWIQQCLCEGLELDGRVREKWSFKEIFALLGSLPSHLTVEDLPPYVLENKERFLYLLPGKCERKVCSENGCMLNPSFYSEGHFKL